MSKDTFFFSHDYEPTTDPKIQAMLSEFGATGYGLFWRITEMLHSESLHKIPLKKYFFMAIANQMLASVEQVESFVDKCINLYELFEGDGVYFWSNRVNLNISYKESMSQKRSEAGKKGAFIKNNHQASDKQVLASAKQNLAYNIIEDNIISNKIIKDKEIVLSEKRNAFRDQLQPFLSKYGKDILNEFYLYWTEPNKSGTKMRFELERAWDLTRRLNRWDSNNKINSKTNKIESKIIESSIKRLG